MWKHERDRIRSVHTRTLNVCYDQVVRSFNDGIGFLDFENETPVESMQSEFNRKGRGIADRTIDGLKDVVECVDEIV